MNSCVPLWCSFLWVCGFLLLLRCFVSSLTIKCTWCTQWGDRFRCLCLPMPTLSPPITSIVCTVYRCHFNVIIQLTKAFLIDSPHFTPFPKGGPRYCPESCHTSSIELDMINGIIHLPLSFFSFSHFVLPSGFFGHARTHPPGPTVPYMQGERARRLCFAAAKVSGKAEAAPPPEEHLGNREPCHRGRGRKWVQQCTRSQRPFLSLSHSIHHQSFFALYFLFQPDCIRETVAGRVSSAHLRDEPAVDVRAVCQADRAASTNRAFVLIIHPHALANRRCAQNGSSENTTNTTYNEQNSKQNKKLPLLPVPSCYQGTSNRLLPQIIATFVGFCGQLLCALRLVVFIVWMMCSSVSYYLCCFVLFYFWLFKSLIASLARITFKNGLSESSDRAWSYSKHTRKKHISSRKKQY